MAKTPRRGGRRILRNSVPEYSCEGVKEVRVVKRDGEMLGCSLENMKLVGVEQGTAADRCGVRGFIGRKVREVNGKRVKTVEQIKEEARRGETVVLGFEEVPINGKGRRSIPEPQPIQRRSVSMRRYIPSSATVMNRTPPELMIEAPYIPPEVPPPPPLDTPFGTSYNPPPSNPPRISRYKFPPNSTSGVMEELGLTPGGGRITFQRAHSMPVSSVRRPRSTPQDTPPDFLHHDENYKKFPLTTGMRTFPERPQTPTSPGGRRRPANNHPALQYNATFLASPVASESVRRKGRAGSEVNGGSHGDIIGGQWGGTRELPAPKIVSKRTGPVLVNLPKPEYRYVGPTKKHPVPSPAVSDIFNHQSYVAGTCGDMADTMNTGKARCRTPTGRRDDQMRSTGRRRSYTPTASSYPPWGTL